MSSNFSEDLEVAKVNRNDITANYLNIDESSIMDPQKDLSNMYQDQDTTEGITQEQFTALLNNMITEDKDKPIRSKKSSIENANEEYYFMNGLEDDQNQIEVP